MLLLWCTLSDTNWGRLEIEHKSVAWIWYVFLMYNKLYTHIKFTHILVLKTQPTPSTLLKSLLLSLFPISRFTQELNYQKKNNHGFLWPEFLHELLHYGSHWPDHQRTWPPFHSTRPRVPRRGISITNYNGWPAYYSTKHACNLRGVSGFPSTTSWSNTNFSATSATIGADWATSSATVAHSNQDN